MSTPWVGLSLTMGALSDDPHPRSRRRRVPITPAITMLEGVGKVLSSGRKYISTKYQTPLKLKDKMYKNLNQKDLQIPANRSKYSNDVEATEEKIED